MFKQNKLLNTGSNKPDSKPVKKPQVSGKLLAKILKSGDVPNYEAKSKC